jgi:hypothetical protein
LHFGDASATLANLRVSAPPPGNSADICAAVALINGAYVRYCRDRAAYLRANPGAPGAGECDALAAVAALDARDIPLVFNFVVCRAFIDRPILCLVLAQTWARHAGAASAEEAAALAAFQACCEWACAIPEREK